MWNSLALVEEAVDNVRKIVEMMGAERPGFGRRGWRLVVENA